MQVQHEVCLIEPSSPTFAEQVNKSLDSYCLLPQLSNSLNPIEQIATCPTGSSSLLAVHLSANNQIVIIDTRSHQRRDKFSLKAYDKKFSKQSFHVSGLAFSPDGQRLAVGQTDCIIYIYKLALGAGGQLTATQLPSSSQTTGDTATGPAQVAKTTISGKFASSSPVTCLIWSELGLIFGGQDGKVRLILSFNKPAPQPGGATSDQNSRTSGQTTQAQQQTSQPKVVTLFTASKGDAMPICLAYKAPVLLVGLSNCTIQALMFSTSGFIDEVGGLSDSNNSSSDLMSQLAPSTGQSSRRNSSIANHLSQAPTVLQSHTLEHSCPPVHLNLIHINHALVVCCSGSDGKIAFHSLKATAGTGGGVGKLSIVSQLQQTIDIKEDILATDYSHTNEILALATKSRLMFVRYDQQQQPPETAFDAEGANNLTVPVQPWWRLQASTIEMRRVHSLTGIRWARDGTQIVVGCSSGALELFRCQWSKQSMNDKLDICHIARNRIRITDRERNLLATYKTLYDIKRVNLLDGCQSVLVWTTSSLLLAKLAGPQSEIAWSVATGGGGGSRRDSQPKSSSSSSSSAAATGPGSKFLFDANSDYVIIYHEASRELRLLKLGQDSVTFTVQLSIAASSGNSSVIKRHFLSVCQFPPGTSTGGARKPSLSPNRTIGQSRPVLVSSNSSRQNSAQQQQQQQRSRLNSSGGLNDAVNALQLLDETNELAKDDQIVDQMSSPSQVERFAYLSSCCQLEIIDLKNANQLIYSHRHAHEIAWLEFSCTGRLLGFLDTSGQLNLLRIKQQVAENFSTDDNDQHADSSSDYTVFELQVLLINCEQDARIPQWLPESDSLLAQAGAIIYIWHNLYDSGGSRVVEKYDTRNYNFLGKPPIIDLSLLKNSDGSSNWKYPKVRALINGSHPNQLELAIELSNNQHIWLDKTKTRFYAKLASGSLESALELLDRLSAGGPPVNTTTCLYTKLGWTAIERAQCELAWKIFSKLQYKSLASYLEECLAVASTEVNDTMNEATGAANNCHALQRLAKLRGDWDKFERLLAHDQEEVIATYRRLNKWSRLVDFLKRKHQFRQRDLAERDQIAWLLERARLEEAAELKATSSGDLVGALELLLERSHGPDEACKFALRNEQKLSLALRTSSLDTGQLDERRLRELLETEIRDKLVGSGQSAKLAGAAAICDRILGQFGRALELYLEANDYESALRVAKRHSELSDRVNAIHLQCADDLRNKFLADRFQTSGKRARVAIDHYLKCNEFARALEMANHLRSTGRGAEILTRHWDELSKLKEEGQKHRDLVLAQCRELARQLQDAGEHAKATKALEMAEDYERLIEMLIGQGELERAFDVSLVRLHAGDQVATRTKFVELAGSYIMEAQQVDDTSQGEKLINSAERIFLLVGQPQLAVEMQEKLGHHDRMLELIERYQTGDQLEASLLQLARSQELAGNLEEAEKYLLRASPGEWTSVVRMYRLAKRWPDAFRVARANCLSELDPLLVQLAYWWAKSLILTVEPPVGDQQQRQLQHRDQLDKFKQARDLLHELNLFKQVVEFACETKNFQFALDVCSVEQAADNSPSRAKVRRELVLRYATFLEQQHKFADAEKLLVDNNLVELAAKMHIDNDQHTEAIRVIERQLEGAPSGGGDGAQPEVEQGRRQQLVSLLNSTLVECAKRIVTDLSAASRRTPPLLMRSQSRAASSSLDSVHPAQSWCEKLQMAQQMFLRAQRPELAIEMYQSLGMWQEAIQVAQRFAPRLLEGVERALDQQVQVDIEPILRQTGNNVTSEPSAEAPSSSGGDTESVGSSAASDQRVVSSAQDRNLTRPSRVKTSGGQASALSAWRQFEFAYRQDDRIGARLHFDKYLGLLLVNVETQLLGGRKVADTGQVARQLRHMDKFLRDCRLRKASQLSVAVIDQSESDSGLIGSILRQQDTLEKIETLAELIFMLDCNWSSMDLNCVIQSHASWSSLRDILANCAYLRPQGQELATSDRLEDSLLVAHYVTLYVSLVRRLSEQKSLERLTIKQVEQLMDGGASREQDSTLDLLSKLSFALLRHANLLDFGRALYLAGLWQLARGHLALTRQLWSALIEWHDSSLENPPKPSVTNGKSSRGHEAVSSVAAAPRLPAPVVLSQFVTNLPASFMVFSSHAAAPNGNSLETSVNHVRHWLLETLIGAPSGAKIANGPPAWARLDANSLACLACGLPVPSVGSLHLSARVALRPHELEELLNLCGDAQSDVPLTASRLKDALVRRRSDNPAVALAQKSSSNGPGNSSRAADQLSEIIDFIIELSATLDSGGR